mmetsp:Transcript_21980/g.55752  ORF Transcript_21980/g.55752 Transcript_21980/m.55752 type:complete len:225 (-) Transcript_21980:444-1118(-)
MAKAEAAAVSAAPRSKASRSRSQSSEEMPSISSTCARTLKENSACPSAFSACTTAASSGPTGSRAHAASTVTSSAASEPATESAPCVARRCAMTRDRLARRDAVRLALSPPSARASSNPLANARVSVCRAGSSEPSAVVAPAALAHMARHIALLAKASKRCDASVFNDGKAGATAAAPALVAARGVVGGALELSITPASAYCSSCPSSTSASPHSSSPSRAAPS